MCVWLMSLNHSHRIQIPYIRNLVAANKKLATVNFASEADDAENKYTNFLSRCSVWKEEGTYPVGSNNSVRFNGKLHHFCYRFRFK